MPGTYICRISVDVDDRSVDAVVNRAITCAY